MVMHRLAATARSMSRVPATDDDAVSSLATLPTGEVGDVSRVVATLPIENHVMRKLVQYGTLPTKRQWHVGLTWRNL